MGAGEILRLFVSLFDLVINNQNWLLTIKNGSVIMIIQSLIMKNVLLASSQNESFRLYFRYIVSIFSSYTPCTHTYFVCIAKMSLYIKNPFQNSSFRRFREYILSFLAKPVTFIMFMGFEAV